MRPVFDEPGGYEAAVSETARSFISRFGKNADTEAWKAARRPSMTPGERAYCEAVAVKVTSALRSALRHA